VDAEKEALSRRHAGLREHHEYPGEKVPEGLPEETMTRKLSDYRVVAEIQCPGFSGGTFTVNRKRDYCALEAAAKESVLGLGCTITLKSVHKSKVPEQGSMFSRKKTTPQQSLFGPRRRRRS
jgi:hypothetical protein